MDDARYTTPGRIWRDMVSRESHAGKYLVGVVDPRADHSQRGSLLYDMSVTERQGTAAIDEKRLDVVSLVASEGEVIRSCH